MTGVFAEVIGDPIAHSKSPIIHNFWLQALAIEADYRATHVAPTALEDYFNQRKHDPDWRGCNITLPHKVTALTHIADPGGVRTSIGAINLAARDEEGVVFGTNTDAAGFYAPLAGFDLKGSDVTLAGAGGAARAILFALARMEVGSVTILNRNPLKASALLSAFGLKGHALPLGSVVPASALLVNATSLGMVGQPPLELDLSRMNDDAIVYDIVYNPQETALLREARGRGMEVIDGLEMLIGQAAVAFEILFGQAPPREQDEVLRKRLTA